MPQPYFLIGLPQRAGFDALPCLQSSSRKTDIAGLFDRRGSLFEQKVQSVRLLHQKNQHSELAHDIDGISAAPRQKITNFLFL